MAGGSLIAGIALAAIWVRAISGGANGWPSLLGPAVAASAVVTLVIAVAAAWLHAAIVAPLSRLAKGFEAADERPARFRLDEAARLTEVVDRLIAEVRSGERDAATQREARLRQELEVAEQTAARADSKLATLASLSEALAGLARGDLTVRLLDASEVLPLAARVDQTVELFAKTMLAFSASLGAINDGATKMQASVDSYGEEISSGTERAQAALNALTKRAEGAAELAAPLSASAALLRDWRAEASRHATNVESGGAGFGEIRLAARQIAPILTLVDEVAFQTNLLALNAGVEAARVGDAGRGIAVVAQELRVLSQRAAEAAKQSSALLSRVVAEAERGAGALSPVVAETVALSERAAKVIAILEPAGLKLADRKAAAEASRVVSDHLAKTNSARDRLRGEIEEEAGSLSVLVGKLSVLIDRFQFQSEEESCLRTPGRDASARLPPPPTPRRQQRS
jgi:methyl-accepting chemotaxis protein